MNTTQLSAVGFRSERGPILAALMLSTALIAIDATIVATASAAITRDMGGFNQLPWVFSSYVLLQAVTTPLFGRLADIVGRRRLMLIGIGVFLLGSVIAGAAWSMGALIAGRAVQGIGAGILGPISMTIVADIYTVEERGRVQGYLAAVWGAASVVGPTLGGVFTQFVDWRWIFFINIPLCVVAYLLFARKYEETRPDGARDPIDFTGSVLVTIGSGALLLGLLEGGQAWEWASAPSSAIFAIAAVALTLFVIHALRTRYPILDLRMLGRRAIGVPALVAMSVGATLLGLTTYIPLYAQEVHGVGPLAAGFVVALVTVGWPIAAMIASQIYMRLGFRATSVIGALAVVVGLALVATIDEDTPLVAVGAMCMVIGFGLGLAAASSMISAQAAARPAEVGAVTGTNAFSRAVGSALGVAVLGAVINAAVIDGTATTTGTGFMPALHTAFLTLAATGVIMLAASISMVGGRPTPDPAGSDEDAPADMTAALNSEK